MDGQTGHSLLDRSVSRRERHGGPKEYRISKADIGGPVMKEAKLSPDKMERGVLILRCVTIQKDERGFGLTVTGDNPVYVQSVRENGAAMSAGVLQGDRIYKVNGLNVIESNHIEVVKLIRAENHVTLTLFSPNATSEESGATMQELPPLPARPHSILLQDNNAFHDEKVNTIKKMLNQEKEEVERIKEEYARNPDKKLLENLGKSQKLLQDLEKQLWKVESSRQLKYPNSSPHNHVTGSVADEGELLISVDDHGSMEKLKDPVKVQQNIINFEDDELTEESQPSQNHGPFLDFSILKTKPAHAAVFLNYVFHSHDPSHLLLLLMTEIYRQMSTNKELNKLSDVISKTYLADNAPLKVSLDEGIAKSIVDHSQSRSLSDDALRSLFDPAAQQALKTVKGQLEQFCSKREQGLSNCYGEEKVAGNLTDTQVVKVVDDILTVLLQDLGQMPSGADEAETQKANAKTDALEKLLAHWTGKKKNRISSRFSSMLRPNRTTNQTRPWSSASVESILEDPKAKSGISGKLKLTKKQRARESTASAFFSANALISSTTSLVHPQNLLEYNDASSTQLHKSNDSLVTVSDYEDKPAAGKDQRWSEKSTRRTADGEFDNTDNDSRTESDAVEATPEYLLSVLFSTHPELDIPPESSWSANAPRQVVKNLDKKECKRQEIINELLQTEQHHVRDLRILSLLFYQKMRDEGGLSQEELTTIFPNLHEMLDIHLSLNKSLNDLKKRDGVVVKEIGSVLADMFLGASGEKFKQACALYCGNQSVALAFIKEKCKKENKFNALIQSIEKHPICRRLQLKDFIPIEFQRLTKYPLLLENIMKNSKKNDDTQLLNVHKKSKEILQFVDKAIKDAEDIQKVVEIQKTLDSSALGKVQHPIAQEYKNINLTERKLIHQGPLSWRVTINEKKKSVGLHCVLFEDIMVLLQKQEDRYVLRCHTNASAPNQKDRVQPPILKLSKVIVRTVATDKRAFYVLSASALGAQMYELVASTAHEMHEWMKLVSATIDIAKKLDTVSTPLEKGAFLLPETPKPTPTRKVDNELKPENVDDIPMDNMTAVDDADIISRLRYQNDIINTALSEKHRMLAAHAGVDPEDLDSIFEISMEDAFPDRSSLVLHLLSLSDSLAMIMNDALNPDTEFLLPTSPHLLTPIPHSTLPNTNSPVADAKTNDVKDLPNDDQLKWDDQAVANDAEVPTVLPAGDLAHHDISTKTENATAELEVAIASDYETASESPSPTTIQEFENSENNLDDRGSNTDASSREEPFLDLSSSVVTEGVESGIATDSNLEKTIESSENDLSSDVLSPMQSETHDLLDFGTHVIMPEDSNSNSSVAEAEKSNLFGKTNPINVTKMLKIQKSMHSQLLRLLEILKSDETTREQTLGDNNRSVDAAATNPIRAESQISEHEVTDDQEPVAEDSILIISEYVSVSPSIQKK